MAAIDSQANKFIGQGLTFPINLNVSGRPDIKGGKELLESSMRAIMCWTLGTRYFLGEWGGKLEKLIQEPNDLVTQALVKHYVIDVISTWEKRLEILDSNLIARSDYRLDIQVIYRVKNTKITDSFIFPYYSQLKF